MPANFFPGIVTEFVYRGKVFRFFVQNILDVVQNCYLSGMFYEEIELQIIEKYIKPDGVYVDVGSNIGNHAIFVENFCSQKEIILIEPNPEAIKFLMVNLLLNESKATTKFLGVGLSDREGSAKVAWVQNNLGSARMIDADDGRLKIDIGDRLLDGKSINFLKIDVEGLELNVLRGLRVIIEKYKPRIFIEVDNENAGEFLKWCDDNNYKIEERFKRYKANENFLLVHNNE